MGDWVTIDFVLELQNKIQLYLYNNNYLRYMWVWPQRLEVVKC